MELSPIDIFIIVAYLAGMVVLGWVMRKRATQRSDSYLLGGKSLPWYYLGLSNASGMFDISGTMWMVTLAFVYGLKSIWIPWLWPVFNQVFLMMYLAAWLRRSNATTGAEWMITRFGSGSGAKMAHGIIVVFALLSCFGFLAYGFIGLGKFAGIFIPWHSISPYLPFDIPVRFIPHFYGVVFTLFAVFYAVLGGMTSIVLADILQYLIMTIAAIIIAAIAFHHLDGQTLQVPTGWDNLFFGWELGLDWGPILPEVNEKINSDGFDLFAVFFMMMLFKGVLASLAGPAPNYDMQKLLSTRSPKEAAKMSGIVSVILLPTRYLMIMGFTVLAILFFEKLNLREDGVIDFEKILPAAILQLVPSGLKGILLAGLLAAFIGTFAGTLNAAQAYIVNDIYLKYIRPGARQEKVNRFTYLSGILVVVLSIALGFLARDVNSILQWIVSALYGSYVAANLLKWHWWRFNGQGFFWGMIAGILPAMAFPYIFQHTLELYYFPLILACSVLGCLIGTYSAPPTDMAVLESFYKTVRPWGFWDPIKERVLKSDPDFRPNKGFGMDMFNIAVGIIAQLCLTLVPIYLVLWYKLPLALTLLTLALAAVILKHTWWNKLED